MVWIGSGCPLSEKGCLASGGEGPELGVQSPVEMSLALSGAGCVIGMGMVTSSPTQSCGQDSRG